MRARFREQVREDVKAAALRQISSGGACAVSVNAIARELGVSGPALYRYFANRDELLADLVADAYHDLAAALAAATDPKLGLSPSDRVRALVEAWRSFALAEPHRYQLLFGPPVPGYDAHAGPLVGASNRTMAIALDVVAGFVGEDASEGASVRRIADAGDTSPEGEPAADGDFSQQRTLADTLNAAGSGPGTLAHVVSAWVRLHGFVGLEAGGNFASMGVDADELFRHEVETLLRDLGIDGNP